MSGAAVSLVDLAEARATLRRIACHILARRRFEATGRFGLRSSPCGVATPAFGGAFEVIRTSGSILLREVGGEVSALDINGATLRHLADIAGTDIGADFACGADTPELGDPDVPLHLDGGAAAELASWWNLGWEVMDRLIAGPDSTASAVQLWPEHFDAATTLTLAGDVKVNVGFSPGDRFLDEPYCYVGPWTSERPGEANYWNAPFGAVLSRADAQRSGGATEQCYNFVARGVALLKGEDLQ